MELLSSLLTRKQGLFVASALLVSGLSLAPASWAWAEEAPPSDEASTPAEPTPEPEPEPTPEPEPEPTPEPEPEPAPSVAPDEPAGWAVVDPDTGDVLNIIVCTNAVCGKDGSFGGKLLDPASGIVGDLVYQTPGQTGGYRSAGDTTVTYNKEDETFTIKNEYNRDGTVQTSTSTLDPKANALRYQEDPSSFGMNELTDFTDEITFRDSGTNIGAQEVTGMIRQQTKPSEEVDISVRFPNWNEGQELFFGSAEGAIDGLQPAVEERLEAEPVVVDPNSGFQPSSITETIRNFAERITNWFRSLFGEPKETDASL